jgi:hypothetical protein
MRHPRYSNRMPSSSSTYSGISVKEVLASPRAICAARLCRRVFTWDKRLCLDASLTLQMLHPNGLMWRSKRLGEYQMGQSKVKTNRKDQLEHSDLERKPATVNQFRLGKDASTYACD